MNFKLGSLDKLDVISEKLGSLDKLDKLDVITNKLDTLPEGIAKALKN